jgi:thiol-disulfide isomerase/thioredoxin
MNSRLLLSLSLLAALLVTGCAKKNNADNRAESVSTVTPVVSVTARTDRAPNFSWKNSSGALVDLDSFHGRVVLVNFWATWCGPCKRELPDLVAISKEMANRNVTVIGVSTDRGATAVQDVSSFVTEHGIPYQIVVSTEELETAFGNIRAIPTSFIISPSGKIVQTIVGGRSKEQFADLLASAANQ